MLAGRDKQSGGTWLGISKDGRVAFLTNFREVFGYPRPSVPPLPVFDDCLLCRCSVNLLSPLVVVVDRGWNPSSMPRAGDTLSQISCGAQRAPWSFCR